MAGSSRGGARVREERIGPEKQSLEQAAEVPRNRQRRSWRARAAVSPSSGGGAAEHTRGVHWPASQPPRWWDWTGNQW